MTLDERIYEYVSQLPEQKATSEQIKEAFGDTNYVRGCVAKLVNEGKFIKPNRSTYQLQQDQPDYAISSDLVTFMRYYDGKIKVTPEMVDFKALYENALKGLEWYLVYCNIMGYPVNRLVKLPDEVTQDNARTRLQDMLKEIQIEAAS